jgi:acylglycerol lipase
MNTKKGVGMNPLTRDQFRTRDGLTLESYHWVPKDFKQNLVIIHGVFEFAENYQHLVEYFSPCPIAIHMMDLRAHGRNQNRKEGYTSIATLADDFWEFLKFLREKKIEKPHLFVHSNGVLLTIDCFERHPLVDAISSLAMSSPAFPKDTYSNYLKYILSKNILVKIIPKWPLPELIKAEQVSRDLESIDRFKHHPLMNRHLTIETGVDLYEQTISMWKKKLVLPDGLPFFGAYGGHDLICDLSHMQHFFSEVEASDKTMKFYPDCYHELHTELKVARDQFFQDLLDWLQR